MALDINSRQGIELFCISQSQYCFVDHCCFFCTFDCIICPSSIYDFDSGGSHYYTGHNRCDIERYFNLKTWITWRFHDVVYISYEIVPEYFVKLNHPSFPWQHVVEEHLAVVFPEKQNKIVCILIINNSITSYSITYHVF